MKRFSKLFLTLIFTFLLSTYTVKAANLAIDEATYDENTSVLTVSGTSNYSEVMVSVFKDDNLLAFKTTSANNANYQTTIKISFAEDTSILVKVGDINKTEYKILNVDVKKSIEPVPPQTITDNQGNALTIVDDLNHFDEHDELILAIDNDFDNLTDEQKAIYDFLCRQLGDDKTLAGTMELRVKRQGDDLELPEKENGYMLLIKVPKEAVEGFKNVYIAGLDSEFNILEGHEFVYDDSLGGLVGYIDAPGMFLIYEDSNVEYKFLDNTANQVYNLDSGDTLTFRINALKDKYVSLEIDEKTVDSKYQTVTSGSTIITISRDYLKNLKLGNHTVKVNFTDGSATTTLKVTNNESSPNTLDNINKYVLIGIISAIVIIAAAPILIIKKKNRN